MRKNLRAGLFRYNNKKTPLRERRLVLAKAAQQNKDKDNSSPRCTTQPNPPQVAFGNRTPNYGHQTALDILCKLFEAEC